MQVIQIINFHSNDMNANTAYYLTDMKRIVLEMKGLYLQSRR